MHDLKVQQGARSLAARRGAARSAVVEPSREVGVHVIRSPLLQAAGGARPYGATDNEVETDVVRAAGNAPRKLLQCGLALRRTGCRELVRVAPGEAPHGGALGTYEPTGDEASRPSQQPVLVIVPVVAFERSGARSGRGRGYYDRKLRRLRPPADILELTFNMQLASSLPRDAHDEPVGFVATELVVLCCTEASHPREPDRPD